MFISSREYRNPHPRNSRQNPFNFYSNPRSRASLNTNQLTSMAEQGASGLSKTLGNIQQILNLIQSAAPVIEEYGPMIKNLPTLYRMLKAVQNTGSEEEEGQSKKLEQTTTHHEKRKESVEEEIVEQEEESLPVRGSKPLLYI